MPKKKSSKSVPSTYIKSPFDLIKAPVDWSIVESKVLIAIVSNLQDRFQRFYEQDPGGQLSLFSDPEFDSNNEVTLNINIKDLNINSKHYDQIEAACERLSKLIVPVVERDEKTGAMTQMYRQLFVAGFNFDVNNERKYIENIQREVDGEESDKTPWHKGRKSNSIIIKISKSVSENYFRGGNFSLHLRNIAHNCRCSYTPHLYMYLSKFREFKNETTIGYEELRKMVGMYKYDDQGRKVNKKGEPDEDGMYPRYKDFNKRVLMPVKEELDKLFELGDVDLVFDYKPIHNGDKKRGNPDKIHFTVKSTSNDGIHEVIEQMSEQERVSMNTIDSEEEARWNRLAQLIEEKDSKWWHTFGKYSSSEGIQDGSLIIRVPTDFVAEKWHEHDAFVKSKIKDIWGVQEVQYLH